MDQKIDPCGTSRLVSFIIFLINSHLHHRLPEATASPSSSGTPPGPPPQRPLPPPPGGPENLRRSEVAAVAASSNNSKPTTPPARDQNNRNSRLLPGAAPTSQQQQQQAAAGGGRKATDQLDELAKQLQDLVPSPGMVEIRRNSPVRAQAKLHRLTCRTVEQTVI